ncbi:MAG: hypothetical protein PHX83_02150, partial [Acidobacteriia bacterium]|nr:hypothetical protein [Terriglobia bacterium]
KSFCGHPGETGRTGFLMTEPLFETALFEPTVVTHFEWGGAHIVRHGGRCMRHPEVKKNSK